MKILDAYRAGVKRADVEAAERLTAMFKNPTTTVDIICFRNRKNSVDNLTKVYESSNVLGKIAYCLGHYLTKIQRDDMIDEFSPSR